MRQGLNFQSKTKDRQMYAETMKVLQKTSNIAGDMLITNGPGLVPEVFHGSASVEIAQGRLTHVPT